MKIIWSPEALDDLEEAVGYLTTRNPAAATKLATAAPEPPGPAPELATEGDVVVRAGAGVRSVAIYREGGDGALALDRLVPGTNGEPRPALPGGVGRQHGRPARRREPGASSRVLSSAISRYFLLPRSILPRIGALLSWSATRLVTGTDRGFLGR